MEEPLIPVVLMSHTAHIRSHRKPRRSASKIAMRAGVAGGVLSTLAVAGASGPANAAEPVTQTTRTAHPHGRPGHAASPQSADATQQAAANYQLQAERDAAAAKAAQAGQEGPRGGEAEGRGQEEGRGGRPQGRRRGARLPHRRAGHPVRLRDRQHVHGPPTATGSVATVIAFLKAQLGDAYVMGATGPNAWDCSGLVQAAFKQVGVDLPRVSQDQSMAGTQVSLSTTSRSATSCTGAARARAYHVGVYVGDGQYLDAANPSKGVVIQDLSGYPATGAVRVL